MARRNDHSRDQLTTMALDAAQEIIETEGLGSLTARKIAKKIGYSVGTLYNLFADLNEIILRVNARTLDDLFNHLQPVSAGHSKAPYETMQLTARAYVAYIMKNRKQWSALFDHTMPEGAELPEWYRERIAKLFALLENNFASMFPSLSSAERKRAARVLWSSLHGTCSLALSGKLEVVAEDPPAIIVELLVSTYIAGLRALQAAMK